MAALKGSVRAELHVMFVKTSIIKTNIYKTWETRKATSFMTIEFHIIYMFTAMLLGLVTMVAAS